MASSNQDDELRCICCGREIDWVRAATCGKGCASKVRKQVGARERAQRRADRMMLRQLEQGTRGGRGGA